MATMLLQHPAHHCGRKRAAPLLATASVGQLRDLELTKSVETLTTDRPRWCARAADEGRLSLTVGFTRHMFLLCSILDNRTDASRNRPRRRFETTVVGGHWFLRMRGGCSKNVYICLFRGKTPLSRGAMRKSCLLLYTFGYLSCLAHTGFVLNQRVDRHGCVMKVYKTAPEVCNRETFSTRTPPAPARYRPTTAQTSAAAPARATAARTALT
jgi:hypothetical protein